MGFVSNLIYISPDLPVYGVHLLSGRFLDHFNILLQNYTI